MEIKKKRSIRSTMRALHRDVGFFVIGIAVIYSLSGLLLVYRDTDLLKKEQIIEKTLAPNLSASDLEQQLHIRGLKIEKTDGNIVSFSNGTYNNQTGEVSYTSKSLPAWLEKLNQLHKTSSQKLTHYGAIAFGLLLLFLAISSFWMFKAGTTHFKRGLVVTGIGIVAALALFIV